MTDYTEAAEAIRADEASTTTTKPREWWMVTRPGACSPFRMYESRESAEIIRAAQEVEYPTIGPWQVVRLLEQPL